MRHFLSTLCDLEMVIDYILQTYHTPLQNGFKNLLGCGFRHDLVFFLDYVTFFHSFNGDIGAMIIPTVTFFILLYNMCMTRL